MQKSKLFRFHRESSTKSGQFKIQNFRLLLLIIGFSLLPLSIEGAMLYFSPENGGYHRGDIFITEVRLDTEGEDINTSEVNINFSPDYLEIIDISNGGSILSLWAESPTFSNREGFLSFVGGIPGGFNGQGKLLSIIFKALSSGTSQVSFQEGSKLLLNDGLGTPAKLSTQKADFTILAEKLEIPKDRWQEELEKDKIPPEPFEIKISQSPTVFEGKYFLSFSTIDRQTGISHYEVKEGKREWKRGKSPYLLEDQSLKSKILVKAVDKAGNERIAEILPPKKPFPYWIILLILLGVGVGYWIIKSVKRKAKNAK